MDFLNQDFVENFTFKLILSGHSVKMNEKTLKQNRKNFTLNSSVSYLTLHYRFCLKLHREGERGLEAVNE
jgi:hypothetical protein